MTECTVNGKIKPEARAAGKAISRLTKYWWMEVKLKHPSVIDTLISGSHCDLMNQAVCLLLALYRKEIHENLLSLQMHEVGIN